MKSIVITSESLHLVDETQTIMSLFEHGLDYLHLRKPHASEADYRRLIEAIDSFYHPRIVIHDYAHLTQQYALAGWHLNARTASSLQLEQAPHSASCHSLEELAQQLQVCQQYCFLSPIFDSISKEGYSSAFDLTDLQHAQLSQRVVALGGINLERISACRDLGFGGVAVLGMIWGKPNHPYLPEFSIKQFDALHQKLNE